MSNVAHYRATSRLFRPFTLVVFGTLCQCQDCKIAPYRRVSGDCDYFPATRGDVGLYQPSLGMRRCAVSALLPALPPGAVEDPL